jgi:hypothetical protein
VWSADCNGISAVIRSLQNNDGTDLSSITRPIPLSPRQLSTNNFSLQRQSPLRPAAALMIERLLLVTGGPGGSMIRSHLFQRSAERKFQVAASMYPSAAPVKRTYALGEVIGRLEVPRLALHVIVVDSADQDEVELRAGHIGDTALPGSEGNIGIVAHREGLFRPLRNIEKTTALSSRRYLAHTATRSPESKLFDPPTRMSSIRQAARNSHW